MSEDKFCIGYEILENDTWLCVITPYYSKEDAEEKVRELKKQKGKVRNIRVCPRLNLDEIFKKIKKTG